MTAPPRSAPTRRSPALGRGDARASIAELYPDLPEHHRRRLPADPAASSSARSRSRSTRCRPARRSSTGRCPREWNIRDAYVKNAKGERVIDFRQSNLHVVNYSVPVRRAMSLDGAAPAPAHAAGPPGLDPVPDVLLQGGLGLLPRAPATRSRLEDGDVRGRASTRRSTTGSLTYGELLSAGRDGRRDPDLRATPAIRRLPTTISRASPWRRCSPGSSQASARRYSYRFLFIPGTIGSITWLAPQRATRLRGSATASSLACVGDAGRPDLQEEPPRRRRDRPRRGARARATRGDRTTSSTSPPTVTTSASTARRDSTSPVGRLTRTPHGAYPEYHTSADDLGVRPPGEPRRLLRDPARDPRGPRERRRLPEHEPQGRAAARQARALPALGGRTFRTISRWRCSGC